MKSRSSWLHEQPASIASQDDHDGADEEFASKTKKNTENKLRAFLTCILVRDQNKDSWVPFSLPVDLAKFASFSGLYDLCITHVDGTPTNHTAFAKIATPLIKEMGGDRGKKNCGIYWFKTDREAKDPAILSVHKLTIGQAAKTPPPYIYVRLLNPDDDKDATLLTEKFNDYAAMYFDQDDKTDVIKNDLRRLSFFPCKKPPPPKRRRRKGGPSNKEEEEIVNARTYVKHPCSELVNNDPILGTVEAALGTNGKFANFLVPLTGYIGDRISKTTLVQDIKDKRPGASELRALLLLGQATKAIDNAVSKKAQKLRCVERDDDLSSSNLATPVRTKETGIENPSSNEDKSLTVQRSSRPRPPLASIDTNAGKKQSVTRLFQMKCDPTELIVLDDDPDEENEDNNVEVFPPAI